MDTMTWPAPTTDQPPPPPPPKKKISKGWIILALVIGAGVIGAGVNAKEEAQFKTDIEREADRSFDDNVTSSGEIDETGYVRDNCAAMLDVDLPSTDITIREGLADGTITVSEAAEGYTSGYYETGDEVSGGLTRSEVISACSSGLRNG